MWELYKIGVIMNGRDFKYWLQGHFELEDGELKPLTIEQVNKIKAHIQISKTDHTDTFITFVEGVLEAFTMIDDTNDDQHEVTVYKMRTWITKRIEETLQEQLTNITEQLPEVSTPTVWADPNDWLITTTQSGLVC